MLGFCSLQKHEHFQKLEIKNAYKILLHFCSAFSIRLQATLAQNQCQFECTATWNRMLNMKLHFVECESHLNWCIWVTFENCMFSHWNTLRKMHMTDFWHGSKWHIECKNLHGKELSWLSDFDLEFCTKWARSLQWCQAKMSNQQLGHSLLLCLTQKEK